MSLQQSLANSPQTLAELQKLQSAPQDFARTKAELYEQFEVDQQEESANIESTPLVQWAAKELRKDPAAGVDDAVQLGDS